MTTLNHGTPGAYGKGCRCDECKAGKRERDRAYYLKNQKAIKARTAAHYANNIDAEKAIRKERRVRDVEKIRARGREAYARDPERIKRNAKEWAEKNPERRKEQQARYRENHRPERQAKGRARYHKLMEEDPERVRAQRRAWAKTPKGALYSRFAAHKRRGVTPDALAREYAAVLLRDPCAYCGEPAVELDHIDPVSLGGSGTWDNLSGACRTCNARKNDQPLLMFLAA